MATKKPKGCDCSCSNARDGDLEGNVKDQDKWIGRDGELEGSPREQYERITINIRKASEYDRDNGLLVVTKYPTILLATPGLLDIGKITLRPTGGMYLEGWDEPDFDPISENISSAADHIGERLEGLLHSYSYRKDDGQLTTHLTVDCVVGDESWRPVAEELKRSYEQRYPVTSP